MNLNKLMLAGCLTRDPELRHLPTGNTAVCGFGLAINEKWKDRDGNQKESVVFVDCEAWGKTGENIAKFFAKGKPIFIEGKLKLDTWKDKTDGSNKSKLKVNVDSFQFVGGKGDEGDRTASTAAALHGWKRPAPPVSQAMAEEDIPF